MLCPQLAPLATPKRGTMQKRILIPRLLCAAAILICCATGAFAGDTLTLLNPPNNGDAAGGVYTSPYNISVNGTPMQLICDDFTTDISVGESWSATPTTLVDLSASSVMNLKFGNPAKEPPGTSLLYANTAEDYAIAAVLVAELTSMPNLTPDQIAGYSFAIWDVFDSTLVGSSTCSDPYGTLTGAQCTDAMKDLTAAESLANTALSGGVYDLNNVSGLSIESLTVYTPNPLSSSQEFLQVSMPEAPFPAILGVDLLGGLGLIAVLRRRKTRILD